MDPTLKNLPVLSRRHTVGRQSHATHDELGVEPILLLKMMTIILNHGVDFDEGQAGAQPLSKSTPRIQLEFRRYSRTVVYK